jgi:HopA1 effector protein family
MTIPDRISSPSAHSLLDILQDIAHHVHLEENGTISHPVHGSVQPDDRFQSLPPVLQQRFLSLQLRNFLYDIYFSGSHSTAACCFADTARVDAPLENNRAWGLNLDFFTALHESNQGQGFGDPDWQVIGQDDDGLVAVQKQELTLHLIPAQHLDPIEQSTEIGATVTIKMPHNRLQNGCYIAIGNAGLMESEETQQVNIFFNVAAAGAASLMRDLTTHLNAQQIPFTFKLPYNPLDYDRQDTASLSFLKPYYPIVWQALSSLSAETQSHLRPFLPFCTKPIAPGIALAEEPDSKFSAQETFGTHRCQLIANGLLAAQQQSESAAEFRLVEILNQFYGSALELEYAYLNAGSEDIYFEMRQS